VTLTQLDLLNLTGTMIWADFWSATEPNLAILCVSLPMLGSLWSRCTARQRGSKLGYSSENATGNSGFSKLKARSRADNQIALESMYAANQQVHYQSAVAAAATPEPDRLVFPHKDGDSGSEVALTEQEPYAQDSSGGIRVQTKRTISHA
jgi:hypothetical protein